MNSIRETPSTAVSPEGDAQWPVPAPLEQFSARARELLHAQCERTLRLRRQVAAQLQRLQHQLDSLQGERDELERQLAARGDAETHGSQEIADLQARLDMALDDLRAAKASRSDAAKGQLQQPSPAPTTYAAAGQRFDWESQKRRLLEQLESDFDPQEPAQKRERLTIESALQATDQVVAEKDHEIAELRRLLENQTSNIGAVAVGAAAVAELLDQDELVREERENLQRLQDEWREKLRRAEVEISVERAKIARERVELDEKLRALENSRANASAGGNASPAEKAKGRPQSRWLTRLGLQDDGA